MTQELEARKHELEAERASIEQRIAGIDAEIGKEREAEHAALVAECRTAKDEYGRIHRETEDAQQAAIHAQNEVRSAQFYLDVAKEQRPKHESYPTRKEISDWEEDVSTKDQNLSAAMEASAKAWERCDGLQHTRRAAQRIFEALAERERNLRHEIEFAKQPTTRNPANSFVMKTASSRY